MRHRVEYWEYNPAWREFVERRWEGRGRVEQIKDDSLADFREQARQAFIRQGFPVKQVKTWINCMIPEEGDGYSEGYPHVHYPLTGLTLVHYLDVGDSDTQIDVFEEEGVITISPKVGMVLFMPNNLKHAVKRNNGTKKRLAMIATALRT